MRTLPNSPKLRGLARNPALPPHLLDVFVAAADDRLRSALAYREDLSAKQLRVLERVPDWLGSLIYPDGPTNPEPYEETEKQSHPDIEKLLRSLRYRDVRRQVARHPDVPVETLIELLDDDDRQVAESAAANPALPESVMAELLGA